MRLASSCLRGNRKGMENGEQSVNRSPFPFMIVTIR